MPTTNPTSGQSQQDQRQQQVGRPQSNTQNRDPQRDAADSNPDRRNDHNRDRSDQNEDRIDKDDNMETGGTDNRGTDIRGNQSARQGGQAAQGESRGGQKDR